MLTTAGELATENYKLWKKASQNADDADWDGRVHDADRYRKTAAIYKDDMEKYQLMCKDTIVPLF